MRNKILLLILFSTSLIFPFIIGNSGKQMNEATIKSIPNVIDQSLTPNSGPLGVNGIWAINLSSYSNSISLDGNLTDWDGIPKEEFDDMEISLAFDENFVYIAVQWEDSTLDNEIGKWNKTGMIDADDAQWEFIGGKDDQLKIGFHIGPENDYWVWTSSNITIDPYVYESEGNYTADSGELPFVMNTNGTDFEGNVKPIYDNGQILIVDWEVIPEATYIDAYFPNTPTMSQTDVLVASDWNNTKENHYTLEFKRALDTGQTDDIVFDFGLSNFDFFIGKIDGETTEYFEFANYDYRISTENEIPTLTFDVIPSLVTEALLIGGIVYDDYVNYDFTVNVTWEYTPETGYIDYPVVNQFTGQWSYLLLYNEYFMPLGWQEIIITFDPKYDDPIIVNQTTFFDDIDSPEILGIVDLGNAYPDGVPIDMEYVTITIAVRDNYDITDDLVAQLYSWKDGGVALMTPLTQFASGGSTFNANIYISYDPTAENLFTYFAQVWDSSNNKITSEYCTFFVGEVSPTTTITLTATIDVGISFIEVIIIGSIAISLMTYSIVRKVKRKR
ncbi:MAG: hypothetical protein GPJ52_14505 [Candidatus Heimdallarchaeota archaeon]|nr:hypothetical protein [Candidatus Heimdallarchaeota archaeon]